MSSTVWMVTGANRGMGLEWVSQVIQKESSTRSYRSSSSCVLETHMLTALAAPVVAQYNRDCSGEAG